jgi:hypothetical protein
MPQDIGMGEGPIADWRLDFTSRPISFRSPMTETVLRPCALNRITSPVSVPKRAAENAVSRVFTLGIVQLLQQQLEGQRHGNVLPAVPQRASAFIDSARSLEAQ